MNSHPHIAAIDFDSQNVQVAVGTRDTTSLSQPLLRADAYPNESIRRGTVIEHNGLSSVVGQILRTLDTAYQHKLPIFMGVHPSSLVTRKTSVSMSLFQNNQPRPITDADCDALTKKAQSIILNENPNSYILTTIPRQYILENANERVRLQVGAKPTGYQASKLSCEFVILTCLSQDVSDFVDVFESYHTDVYDVFVTPLTTSLLVTNQRQRILGCGVLYISSEVSSFVLFEDGQPSHVATFPIGIEDVVSDIAVGLQMHFDRARQLLSDPARVNDEQPAVRKRFYEVMNARYMDIVEHIERTLTSLGHPVVLPAGIVIITTSIQLHTLCDTLYQNLKIPTKLWEGDIPSAQSKKRNRDISIIGAYSIVCSAGGINKPIYSPKSAILRILRDAKSAISATIHKFLT